MKELEKIIEDAAIELLRIATTELHKEYVDEINNAIEEMEGEIGQTQLRNIVENIRIAREHSLPICQDTGIVAFLMKLGDDFPLRSKIKEILTRATRISTEKIPLRPNAVDLFKGNTGDNVGMNGHVPILYIDLVEGDGLELIAMPKGGGSSNVASLGMLKPGQGMKGVKQFVIESLAKAGPLGCPPYFVGVGIGGGEELCMFLAKKALLKPFKQRHLNPEIANMEEELLQKINKLGIGAMGMGEGPSALDLHIEVAARHPASLPVGVVISCWALRHATATVESNGNVTINK